MNIRSLLLCVVAAAAALALPARAQTPVAVVFSGEANRLNAYDTVTGNKQTVIPSAADTKSGLDINAQICFFPDGSRRFIAGEDTAQGTGAGGPGWGIFQLSGSHVGEFSAKEVGKLVPTFLTSDRDDERMPYESNPENYGCGFLSDGRVVTTDVGNQYPLVASNGQLIVWFPPFDTFKVRYCKVDIGIGTAGGIYVDDDDRVYVASNRPGFPDTTRLGGIYRFTGPFPTSDTSVGGCEATDRTGAPMTTMVPRERFITALPGLQLATPSAIIRAPSGGFYVSSVFDGRIAEYTAAGTFVRLILQPSAGLPPYGTGTPFGLGLGPDGTLYYADLGVVVGPPPGPGDKTGTLRRIRFVDGEPQAPETMDKALDYPDGIGILLP